jgi:transcriptional regulator with XRE-family HTH domain
MANAKKTRRLSDLERQAHLFDLRQQGMTFAEIAWRMEVSPQAVHHALKSFARLCCHRCQAELNQAGARTTDRGKALCLACLAKHPEASFAEHLRAYRIAAELKRKELARLTRVSVARLTSYESGFARTTSWADQVRLFRALGVRLIGEWHTSEDEAEERWLRRAVFSRPQRRGASMANLDLTVSAYLTGQRFEGGIIIPSRPNQGPITPFNAGKSPPANPRRYSKDNVADGSLLYFLFSQSMFSLISGNWAGEPLVSYEVMLQFIRRTRSATGFYRKVRLDTTLYATGQKVSKEEQRAVRLQRRPVLPRWNYTIYPRPVSVHGPRATKAE